MYNVMVAVTLAQSSHKVMGRSHVGPFSPWLQQIYMSVQSPLQSLPKLLDSILVEMPNLPILPKPLLPTESSRVMCIVSSQYGGWTPHLYWSLSLITQSRDVYILLSQFVCLTSLVQLYSSLDFNRL